MSHVLSEFIKFPLTTLEHATVMKTFAEYTGCKLPQVVGAIDRTYIEIFAPARESKADYYSWKQKSTTNTQAVIGANFIFLYVATEFPGSKHDSRRLRSYELYPKCVEVEILSKSKKVIGGFGVCSVLLDNRAYPPTSG